MTDTLDPDQNGTHQCPINGCSRRIPYVLLMCRRHWAKVPGNLQRAVYRAWRGGGGAGTQAHIDAVDAAIAAVHDELRREATITPRLR